MSEEQEPLPPLAELVTDDDLRAAAAAYERGPWQVHEDQLRAALEAYGARLVDRLGQGRQ